MSSTLNPNEAFSDVPVYQTGGGIAAAAGSHVEGYRCNVEEYGDYGHAEGFLTNVIDEAGHAEGEETKAGYYSHAEGYRSFADNRSHAEGKDTIASGDYSHSEGERTIAFNDSSHAEGTGSVALGEISHAEGGNSSAQTRTRDIISISNDRKTVTITADGAGDESFLGCLIYQDSTNALVINEEPEVLQDQTKN